MSASKTTSATVLSPTKKQLREEIFIKGANSNNLNNVDLRIPKNKLVVVTGVSGSGKSSITMDTLYAEGQRRYVESLSSYARQFLMRMKKPEVDFIKGICPAIAIEQKVSTSNARSTVGTLTEIYDYLRLLFARAGRTYSPISGVEVKRDTVADVVDYILDHDAGQKVLLYIPLQQKYSDREMETELKLLLQKGFTRLQWEGETMRVEDILDGDAKKYKGNVADYAKKDIRILLDRFVVKKDDEENRKRIADSVQISFQEANGECIIDFMGLEERAFNNRFEADGIEFLDPTPQLFNFNNPSGACPTCEGFSKVMGIDAKKAIPDPSKSIYDGAIACFNGDKSSAWQTRLIESAHKFGLDVHSAFKDLPKEMQRAVWRGNKYWKGIDAFFDQLREKTYKIQNRVMLARYRGRTTCTVCEGGRLRKEATYVQVGGKNIVDLTEMPIDELLDWFENIELNEHDYTIAKRLILEVTTRLRFMVKVGLSYLTINRLSNTLSGGETQRINLTRTLGSNLTASMYILDEPSIGLHPRDTGQLVDVLKDLRDLGNTVIVVEHEEDVIAAADYLIDIGPEAGVNGGHVVFAGPYKDIYEEATDSLTTKYMNGKMKIPVPDMRRKSANSIWIKGASQNNLLNIDAKFPLNTLTVVTGVSGSGKTTLVKSILYPAMKKHFGESYTQSPGLHKELTGDLDQLTQVEMISQSPIGKSSRSNPVTYVKAYDAIRTLMSNQQLSRIRGFQPKHFSFNVDGGRCDTCKGEGEQVVEMQFLADVRLVCEECNGKKFKREVLDVRYNEKNIFEILELSIEEALTFFEDRKDIVKKITPLFNVGLGYVQLGQSSSTLSGGEAQRVKLASFLTKENRKEKILFIFDEPTTGLHFHDIRKLLDALNALVEKGHTVLVVEHNMEVIKSADWVIDLGPGGGKHGGNLVFQGTPEALAEVKESFTGQFLKEKLKS